MLICGYVDISRGFPLLTDTCALQVLLTLWISLLIVHHPSLMRLRDFPAFQKIHPLFPSCTAASHIEYANHGCVNAASLSLCLYSLLNNANYQRLSSTTSLSSESVSLCQLPRYHSWNVGDGIFFKPSARSTRLMLVISSNLNTGTSSPDKLWLRHSTKTVLWCAAESSTYIILTLGSEIVGHAVPDILDDAYDALKRHIDILGDGPIPDGFFLWESIYGPRLSTWNSNNHQQTFGVLAAAISALTNYMRTKYFGAVTFWIFDGTHEVGKGTISSS